AHGAVVIVVHDRADAWAVADRVAVLINGRVCADGAPQAILDQPPTAEVARFLGYDGELATSTGVLLTRPKHVRIDPLGDVQGTVRRVIPVEDGLHILVESSRGRVWSAAEPGAARPGDVVTLGIVGGVEFAE